jgi:DNA-binding NarL/FixJ family response regulator
MDARTSGSTSSRLYICDARSFDRAALSVLLESEQVPVARIADLVQELAARPDPVVLIGSRIVREQGSDAVDELHAANRHAIVILVGVDVETLPTRARQAHADGYLLRDDTLAARLKQSLAI